MEPQDIIRCDNGLSAIISLLPGVPVSDLSPLLLKTCPKLVTVPVETIDEALFGVPKEKFPQPEELWNDYSFAHNLTMWGLAYRFLGNITVGNQLLQGAETVFNNGLAGGFNPRERDYCQGFHFMDVSQIPSHYKQHQVQYQDPLTMLGKNAEKRLPSIFLEGEELRRYNADFYLQLISLAQHKFEHEIRTPRLDEEDLLRVTREDIDGLTDNLFGILPYFELCQDTENIKSGRGFTHIFSQTTHDFLLGIAVYGSPTRHPLYIREVSKDLKEEADTLLGQHRTFIDSFHNGKETQETILHFYNAVSNVMINMLMVYGSRLYEKYHSSSEQSQIL